MENTKLFIFIIGLIFSMCSCSNTDKNYESLNSIDIEQDIVLIYQYQNYAWGYQNNGSFIDKNGNVYEFDLSSVKDKESSENVDILKSLHEIMKTSKPVRTISTYDVKYMYCLLYKINPDAEIKSKSNANDMGQYTLYGVICSSDGSEQLITINSYGDIIYRNQDKNAEKLYEYWKSVNE